MKTAVIGYPRIGTLRELKFATEQYFKGEISEQTLQAVAQQLRQSHWLTQQQAKIDFISCHDFSFYDQMLDTAVLFNAVPIRYRQLKLSPLAEYFAMARGYQGEHGDVKALSMKKWFNTNYHYLEPELSDDCELKLVGDTFIQAYLEAKVLNIHTKPVIIGPFTFLSLARYCGQKGLVDFIPQAIRAYQSILDQLNQHEVTWVQFDEPALVRDLNQADITYFNQLYQAILPKKKQVKVLLQTYFGDIRDSYPSVIALDFDGIGLDFIEGEQSLTLLKKYGLKNKILFAGVVNGKNIWKNDYARTLKLIDDIIVSAPNTVLNTSCSLLHVPYTLDHETTLSNQHRRYFAFAQEKLSELCELSQLAQLPDAEVARLYQDNQRLFSQARHVPNHSLQMRINQLTEADFKRKPDLNSRAERQAAIFSFPVLPTTTIGSFPQTADVRSYRAQWKKGEITAIQYQTFIQQKIVDCIERQVSIGLDVLVHGEFERNDMVEFFGEYLEGFIFTEKAWVQSYGTRCVKPPIIWGDVSRKTAMTVSWSVYAQQQTDKPVKGMLTGPVTILNWSFPREDLSARESALQIALAMREEVLDLEAAGIGIIQVDEAALKEKLPLRRQDWHRHYLDWAIPAFRLVHSGVKPETQIHTHMCYSQFEEIINEIDAMDADVISFEASRSHLSIIHVLKSHDFQTAVGPGVYDIHSPRIPTVEEISRALEQMLEEVGKYKLWVNPDCGLKTRGEAETTASLTNMVTATKRIRDRLSKSS